jgi:hypothetical protein
MLRKERQEVTNTNSEERKNVNEKLSPFVFKETHKFRSIKFRSIKLRLKYICTNYHQNILKTAKS